MLYREVARLARRIEAGIVSIKEQQQQARAIRPEWQEFLDRSDFEFNQDALSKELVSLSSVGLEEAWVEPGHGFQSVHDTIDWWSDGEDSRYETN